MVFNLNNLSFKIKTILGASKFKGNEATKRGLQLEPEVLREVELLSGQKFRSAGLHISTGNTLIITMCYKRNRKSFFTVTVWPMFGASPDGINEKMVAEIKCPKSSKSAKNYVADNGDIGQKYLAQVMLQMSLSGRKEALFCVADPAFEKNKKIVIKHVHYDESLVNDLMNRSIQFWKSSIFPMLEKSCKAVHTK